MKQRNTQILLLTALIFFSLKGDIQAGTKISTSEVENHNKANNCWMIFEDRVYDFSNYISDHDVYLDIRDWCGQDMTEDFKTKAGLGRDHKARTYAMLDDYYIGDLETKTEDTSTGSSQKQDQEEAKVRNPYNFWLPFLASLFFYLATWRITKVNSKNQYIILTKNNFNLFWNSMLLLTLVPSFLFGIVMTLQFQFSSLINFASKLYFWHVEGSIIFGTIAVMHLITRLTQYLAQIKSLVPNPR
ncbi:hypothetical protein JW766_00695 [Candidatus Dojkabacteria bacterium]|nr:hypothetical protein [Candidatus Dojkabacteria bacterium]